jgi:hypothetical protein
MATNKGNYSPKEQQATIKKHFDNFRASMAANDWSKAFMIAFSLMESRIQTLYTAECDFRRLQGLEPAAKAGKGAWLNAQVEYLKEYHLLRPEEVEEIRQIAHRRNQLFHDYVWSADQVNESLCLHTIEVGRKVDNARKRQKTRHRKALGDF